MLNPNKKDKELKSKSPKNPQGQPHETFTETQDGETFSCLNEFSMLLR